MQRTVFNPGPSAANGRVLGSDLAKSRCWLSRRSSDALAAQPTLTSRRNPTLEPSERQLIGGSGRGAIAYPLSRYMMVLDVMVLV
jgi:hypothetical protein